MFNTRRVAAGLLILIGLSVLLWRSAQALKQTGLSAAATQPFIKLNQQAGTIEVLGLDARSLAKLRQSKLNGLDGAEWATLLAVYSTSAIAADTPAMLGSYAVADNSIRFVPRFPLVAGLRYTVRFNFARYRERFEVAAVSEAAPVIETSVMLPKVSAGASTFVAQVYPSASELPANQLKLYLCFSAPMSLGEAYQHLRLLDAAGREVPHAFLRVEQELWDATRQRFTLIFDPGRVKRGLRSNVEDGAPLRVGGRYRLVIDAGWRDGEGNSLREAFEKVFSVTAPDRTAPDCRAWQLLAPAANTTEPLRLQFAEPLDYALLEEMLVVFDAQGQPVTGRIEVTAGETQWLFTPKLPWRAGSHTLRVNPKLEDRAGNNLRRLFDVDLSESSAVVLTPPSINLPFIVKTASSL
jgi:hypothetical protein